MSDQVVIFEELEAAGGSRIGVARLNAPRAMNALSLEMIHLLKAKLDQWAADDTIGAVWLEGEGDKALSIGLVEEVVPQGAALDKALELAEMAGKQSPSSVARCKTLVMSARDGRSHDDGWRMERELFIELFSTEDQREGVNAFLEKRTPEWKNR